MNQITLHNAETIISNCMDCPFHKVIADPDPYDWFNEDDVAVLCQLTDGNPNQDDYSKWRSDQQSEHRCITAMCRPYNMRSECEIPDWCPKLPQRKHPDQVVAETIAENLKAIK